jgi:anti-sigma-K factor RskA
MDEHERDERVDELLGAYALDAVDGAERERVEELLRADPRAAQELDEHREVAAALAWSSADAPPGLWDRIAASLEEQPPAPSGELARVMPMRRRRWPALLGAAAIGVAAALVAVLVVSAARRDDREATMRSAMEHALDSPDSRRATLRNADGSAEADVVIDAEGHGFLAGTTLPQLPSDRTYQLWGVIDGRAISLGVLGHRPAVASFVADGNLTVLMLTDEVAGGVPTDGNPEGALSATIS